MDGKVSIRGAHEADCSRYSGFQQEIAAAGVIHANRTVNSEIRLMLFKILADGNPKKGGFARVSQSRVL
jgi:hypothetical protein